MNDPRPSQRRISDAQRSLDLSELRDDLSRIESLLRRILFRLPEPADKKPEGPKERRPR